MNNRNKRRRICQILLPLLVLVLVLGVAASVMAQTYAPITPPAGATVPTGAGGQGSYVEAPESPALRLGKATLKLRDAVRGEWSSSVSSANRKYKSTLRKNNNKMTFAVIDAKSEWLRLYYDALKAANDSYSAVEKEAKAIDGHGEGREDPMAEMIEELREQTEEMDREDAFRAGACWLDSDTCEAPDPDTQKILFQINRLVGLINGDSGRKLSGRALANKAKLLRIRSQLLMTLVKRSALALSLKVVDSPDGSGTSDGVGTGKG